MNIEFYNFDKNNFSFSLTPLIGYSYTKEEGGYIIFGFLFWGFSVKF